jgi:hypothetical protein
MATTSIEHLKQREQQRRRELRIQIIKNLRGVGSILVEKRSVYKDRALAMMLSTAYCWYLNILRIYYRYTRSILKMCIRTGVSTAVLHEKRETNRNFGEEPYGYNTEAIPR